MRPAPKAPPPRLPALSHPAALPRSWSSSVVAISPPLQLPTSPFSSWPRKVNATNRFARRGSSSRSATHKHKALRTDIKMSHVLRRRPRSTIGAYRKLGKAGTIAAVANHPMLSTEIPACRKKYGMRVEMKLPQTPYGMEVMPKIQEGARRGSVMMGCRIGSSVMVSLCGTHQRQSSDIRAL
jgi:hypothetical protein